MPDQPIRVLVVDDTAIYRKIVSDALQQTPGIEVVGRAPNGQVALAQIDQLHPDIVTLDVEMPVMDGLETLHKIKQSDAAPEVIMISGHGTIETAVRATKLGAFDFLEKPLSIEKTLILVKNAAEARRLRLENRDLKSRQPRSVIVGESIPMKALRQQMVLHLHH